MKNKGDNRSRSLAYFAWRRLIRNKIAMVGFAFVLLNLIVAVLGSLIRPDPTPYANDQKLELQKMRPGFEITMLKVRKNKVVQTPNIFSRMFFGGRELRFKSIPIWKYEFNGSTILIERYTGNNEKYPGKKIPYNIVDVVYPIDPNYQYREENGMISFKIIGNSQVTTESISLLQQRVREDFIIDKTYWLGTDLNGRDLLSRLMSGALVSLSVGLISVVISLLIGIFFGAIAGYFRGWVDDVIMWIINVVWSIPTLLLVIAMTFALGKGFWQIFVAVGLTMWVEVARVIRGQFISLRELDYVQAGRAMGFSHFRLIMKHVLPNAMAPVIVISAANFASAILIESGLSFLGIGIQPPMGSWGRMINENYGLIMADGQAYLAILPGLAVMAMVLSFMLIGNGLRDALDTHSVDDNRMSSGMTA